MAPRERQPRSSVIQTLQETPYAYEYYQAVRLIELLNPHKVPVGEGSFSEQEGIELHARVFLDWPPSDLYKIEMIPHAGSGYKLMVNFFGLAGAQGPLPLPFTERLLERHRRKDFAFESFLNMFNHRLLSILYRIRKKYTVGLDFKKPEETQIAKSLLALTGIGLKGLRNRLDFPDRALLSYAGLLWQRPRSLKGAEVLFSHYFKVPVILTPFKGKWRLIEVSQQTVLGKISGRMNRLGDSAALGNKIWDSTASFEVTLGPLPFNLFLGFLKTGPLYKVLVDLIRFYFPLFQECTLRLSLKKEEQPLLYLGQCSFLGWTSWLGKGDSRPFDDQVCLSLD